MAFDEHGWGSWEVDERCEVRVGKLWRPAVVVGREAYMLTVRFTDKKGGELRFDIQEHPVRKP